HRARRAFDLLGILIASQPRVVSKSELLESLWPETFVVEGNLSNLVAEVRQALQDDPHNPRFVRTAHGLGYAFCGSLSAGGGPAPASARPPAPPCRRSRGRRRRCRRPPAGSSSPAAAFRSDAAST